jgi:RNA polymerase sigma-70 factor (ECF subfamily)
MDSSDQSDAQLLILFSNGMHKAFDCIYERYWRPLYNISRSILEDDDRAKDTVQEVFVSFYEHAKQKEIRSLRAYLFQSVKYQCFMQLRSGRISEKNLQRMQIVIAANLVEEEVEASDLQRFLDEEIASLPEKCREVFYLSRVELLPNKKIAERLKISPKTVENQITKALKSLKMSVDKLVVLILVVLS